MRAFKVGLGVVIVAIAIAALVVRGGDCRDLEPASTDTDASGTTDETDESTGASEAPQ